MEAEKRDEYSRSVKYDDVFKLKLKIFQSEVPTCLESGFICAKFAGLPKYFIFLTHPESLELPSTCVFSTRGEKKQENASFPLRRHVKTVNTLIREAELYENSQTSRWWSGLFTWIISRHQSDEDDVS